MFINQQSQLYVGDCAQGDREATSEEVAAWEESRTKSEVDAKLAKVREVREAMLNRMAGIAYAEDDTITTAGFRAARLALLDITTGCPTDPALVDGFILNKYSAIRAVLPPSLIKAFAGVDA